MRSTDCGSRLQACDHHHRLGRSVTADWLKGDVHHHMQALLFHGLLERWPQRSAMTHATTAPGCNRVTSAGIASAPLNVLRATMFEWVSSKGTFVETVRF